MLHLIFSTLLFAAYSVAVSANDSEYLAEICKDLAISMATEQGKLACEAQVSAYYPLSFFDLLNLVTVTQDEVLQVCDQLYLNEKITENQLLYLRHLVLIREEPVAALYDDFQEVQNIIARLNIYIRTSLKYLLSCPSAPERSTFGKIPLRACVHSSIPKPHGRRKI